MSKACEAAQANLKSAQSKMKFLYDENAREKNLKPGDKVLALLPIPSRHLQARYYGLYTAHKKISDVNYIINIPGASKNSYVILTCRKNTLIEIILL